MTYDITVGTVFRCQPRNIWMATQESWMPFIVMWLHSDSRQETDNLPWWWYISIGWTRYEFILQLFFSRFILNLQPGNSSASLAWYSDATDRPIKRLQQNLSLSFPSKHISLPSDSNCTLTATKNVFGRYLNGIQSESVCSKAATRKTATGEFIHAEQSRAARSPVNYNAWSQAVLNTFDVICADGMVIDPTTKLCTFN